MSTLPSPLANLAAPNEDIAGYVVLQGPLRKKAGKDIRDGIFYYSKSSNEHLPAAVSAFDAFGKGVEKPKIYTTLPEKNWLRTFSQQSDKLITVQATDLEAKVSAAVGGKVLRAEVVQRKVAMIAGRAEGEAPLPNHDLYQAAANLIRTKTTYKNVSSEGSDVLLQKGLHRALRYYMLAAYSLLGKIGAAPKDASDVDNLVATLLVDKNGRIFSYGVNSGSFHHGEVNALLNYFCEHPQASQLPGETIIFSTLTPCEQCSKYIESARDKNSSIILIGQTDWGANGMKGEDYGKHFLDVTDTIQIYHEGKKRCVQALLEGKVGKEPRIATQIGKVCKEILADTHRTFEAKVGKSDQRKEKGTVDALIKDQVLNYLNRWLAGVSLKRSEHG